MPFQYRSTCLSDWRPDDTTTSRDRLVVTLNGGAELLVRADPYGRGGHVIDHEEVPECLATAFGPVLLRPYTKDNGEVVIIYIAVYQEMDGLLEFSIHKPGARAKVSSRTNVIGVRPATLDDRRMDNFLVSDVRAD